MCALVGRGARQLRDLVCASETVASGATMFELHSNFTWDGRRADEAGVWPTEDAVHETCWRSRTASRPGSRQDSSVSTSARGRAGLAGSATTSAHESAPESWGLPVGLSLSMEIGYQRPVVSPDIWTWEIRPIIDKQLGRWYMSVNPALERSWHGPTVTDGLDFAPDGTIGFDVNPFLNVAAEYYASFGSLTHFSPIESQQHQLFGAINLNWSWRGNSIWASVRGSHGRRTI